MFEININDNNKYTRRREIVFLVLSGLFIGTLAMLNILGITRLIDFSFTVFGFRFPFRVFVGVLPYPITFLCTDFISEMYGKKRATYVVWTGLLLNLWVLFILWIGGILPPTPEINPSTRLPYEGDPNHLFFNIRMLTFSATIASMIAYLTAQFIDIHIFHFFKNYTMGRHLWLRNNGSTLTSQFVDSVAVVLITYFFTHAQLVEEGKDVVSALVILIMSNYFFKMTAALLDTIPFYLGVGVLKKYLNIDPLLEYGKG